MQTTKKSFTLIELLVVVAIIGLLISILLPTLTHARGQARIGVCTSNLRQMGIGLQFYANEWNDRFMPAYYDHTMGTSAELFWWGQRVDENGLPAASGQVDHTKGFLWPYLKAGQQSDDVFQCPALPWGTYAEPTSTPGQITSAYGYNAYYLCPPCTGWKSLIGEKPWQKTTTVQDPASVLAFADAAVDMSTELPQVSAYLDPPTIYVMDTWMTNQWPTTHFRHQRHTAAVFVDGHGQTFSLDQGQLADTPGAQKHLIGYIGSGNHPYYIPDYQSW